VGGEKENEQKRTNKTLKIDKQNFYLSSRDGRTGLEKFIRFTISLCRHSIASTSSDNVGHQLWQQQQQPSTCLIRMMSMFQILTFIYSNIFFKEVFLKLPGNCLDFFFMSRHIERNSRIGRTLCVCVGR
jgi:hypothetical protein